MNKLSEKHSDPAESGTSAPEALSFWGQLKAMLQLAMPMIIIQVAISIMQIADAKMVGVLGEAPLAASLPASLIYFVPISFGMGLLSGVNPFVSQHFGKGSLDQCGFYAWQGIWMALGFGLATLPLGFVAEDIFGLFGHVAKVRALEVTYFQVSLAGTIPILICSTLSNFFIGIHRPKVLAIYASAATLLNIFFNYLLIYGHWGFPALGMAGAAWGTVLATSIQTIGLLFHFLSSGIHVSFNTRTIKKGWREMKELIRIGVPASLHFGFDILSWGVVLIYFVGLFGTDHLAATTIVTRFMHISFMPPFGLANVLTAMVGKAIGQGRPDRARIHVRTAWRATVTYMGSLAILFYIFRYQIAGSFTDNQAVIDIGASVMVCVAVFQIFDAMNIVFLHGLRGAGDTFFPAVMTLTLCGTLFVGGGFYVVHHFPEWGSVGPWAMGAVYITCSGTFMLIRWHRGKWENIKLSESPESKS